MAGLAIQRTDLSGIQWRVAVNGFLIGPWLLPATVLLALVAPPRLVTAFRWGALLAVSMALVAWGTITADDNGSGLRVCGECFPSGGGLRACRQRFGGVVARVVVRVSCSRLAGVCRVLMHAECICGV